MFPSSHSPCMILGSCLLPPAFCFLQSLCLTWCMPRFIFDTWKKPNFQGDVTLTGSFCLPCRPISLTSSVSLHSSPAMQCFQTISMRMKSECYRPLVSKPTWETIPVISEQYFFGLFHVLWLNIKHFSSVCLLVTGGWWPHCNVLSLILTWIC